MMFLFLIQIWNWRAVLKVEAYFSFSKHSFSSFLHFQVAHIAPQITNSPPLSKDTKVLLYLTHHFDGKARVGSVSMKDGLKGGNIESEGGAELRKNVIFLSPAFEYGYSTEFLEKKMITKMFVFDVFFFLSPISHFFFFFFFF